MKSEFLKLANNSNGSNGGVPQLAIDFAQYSVFFEPTIMMKKYLGKKLYKIHDTQVGGKEPVTFYTVINDNTNNEGMVIVPYTLGRLLIGKNLNFVKEFPQRKFDFTGSLLPHQERIIPTLRDHLSSIGTTTIGLYPGAGKTVIGAWLGSWSERLTCVLINMTSQISQWKNTFDRFTNAKVLVVPEGQIPSNLDWESIDVIICMDERIFKIPGTVRGKVGTLIIDEAHLFCTRSRIGCWLSFQPRYLILETATLRRPDDAMERMAYTSAGLWGVFEKSLKEFHVTPVKTKFIPERIENKQGKTDYHHLIDSLLKNKERNKLIVDIAVKWFVEGRKILILSPGVDHVKTLCQLIKERNVDCDHFCGNQKMYNETQVLVGTFSKIGTAFDEAAFSPHFNGQRLDLLIMCGTIKKMTTLEQVVGRIMRSAAPEVYVLLDHDTIFEGHWSLMKWYIGEETLGIIREPLNIDKMVSEVPQITRVIL